MQLQRIKLLVNSMCRASFSDRSGSRSDPEWSEDALGEQRLAQAQWSPPKVMWALCGTGTLIAAAAGTAAAPMAAAGSRFLIK
jgi:hypothetical protein